MHQQCAQQSFHRGKAAQSLHRTTRSAQLFPARRKHRTKDLPVLQLSHVERLDQPWKIVSRYLSAYAGYPHPYFVNKFLVFMGLQAWLRCKIVKTKELSAKSSRIRSYGLDLWDTSLDSHE
jgi:hypothetical protein